MGNKNKFIIGTSRTSGAGNLFIALSDFEGILEKWNNLFDMPMPESFVYIKEGWYSSVFNREHLNNIINKIKTNLPQFTEELFFNFNKDMKEFRIKIKELKKEDSLTIFHKQYIYLFKHYAIYIPVSRFVESAAIDLIKNKYPTLNDEKIFLLSRPEEFESTQRKYKKKLIELTFKFKKEGITHFKKSEENFKEEINKIISEFGWIKSYIDFKGALTIEEVIEEINNLLSKNNLEKEYERFTDKEENLNKKKEIIQKYQIKEGDYFYFKVLSKIAEMKTNVQDNQAYLSFIGKRNYDKICSIFGLSLEDLKWLNHYEIGNLLDSQRALPTKLINDLGLLIEKRKEGVKILPLGLKAIHITDKDLIERICRDKGIDLRELFYEDIEEKNVIKGIAASPGKITGEVAVVLSLDDAHKLKDKNKKNLILVAHELTPDYTHLLGNVIAIVSDIGGITSHAAIIARELNKPCIIGTKIATKMLKDEDLIELDANNGDGIIKILKKDLN